MCEQHLGFAAVLTVPNREKCINEKESRHSYTLVKGHTKERKLILI